MTGTEPLEEIKDPIFLCPMCDGEKRVLLIVYGVNEGSGIPAPDEKRKDVVTCPACGGAGIQSETAEPWTKSYYIENNFLPAAQ